MNSKSVTGRADIPPRFTLPRQLGPFTRVSLVLFGVAWAICLIPFVLEQTLPGPWEGDTNRNLPFRAALIRTLWSANFPDLAPGMFFGHPILTFGQTALLYPANLLGVMIPVPPFVFHLTDLWIHAVLASAGCAWMLRRRGHSPVTALALGWVYANSSAFLFRTHGHWTLVHQAALLPWLLGAWEAMERMRSGRARRAVALWTMLLALTLLAQNPQWLYVLAILLCPLELGRTWRRRRLMPTTQRLTALGLSVVAALLLGAATVLPTLAGLGKSFRSVLVGADLASRWPLVPFNLIAHVSPLLLFGDNLGEYLGRWFAVESVSMAARATVVLAAVGVARLFLRAPRRLLGRGALPSVLLVGGLFFATAAEMPWFGLLVDHLPLFDSFRAWGRASIFVVVGLVLFAAEGLDQFISRGRGRIGSLWGVAALAAALMTLALAARWRLGVAPEGTIDALIGAGLDPRAVARHPGGPAGIAAGMRADLLLDATWYAAWALLALLAVLVRANWGRRWLAAGVALLLALEALTLQRFVWAQRAPLLTPESQPALTQWLREQRAEVAPAPLMVTFGPSVMPNFALNFEGVRSLSGSDVNARRDPLVWLNRVQGYAHDAYQLETHIEIFTPELLEMTGIAARIEHASHPAVSDDWLKLEEHRVLLFPDPPPYAEIAASEDADAEVSVTEWTEGQAQLEVRCTEAVTVRVREFPDRRWRICVDGERLPVQTDGESLLIPVPARAGLIELKFIDAAARLGLCISLAGWLALATRALLGRRRRAVAAGAESILNAEHRQSKG